MDKNVILITIVLVAFFGLIFAEEMFIGNIVNNVDDGSAMQFRLASTLTTSVVIVGLLYFMNKKAIEHMHHGKLLILLWFAGVTGFFLVLANIFLAMIPLKDHQQIIVYEPNSLIFWIEIGLIVFILITTIWILYNYISGKAVLVLEKRTQVQ